MFAKNKVSQSLIDAVNEVTKLDEASPIKEPTPTGMRVYGRNYGNSAKAKQDQTKSSVDDLKGPKAKELLQKDKEDHMKTKGRYDEELKGDQHKIDANKNKKIDAHDFAILRGKKKVAEELKGDQHKIDANKNNKVDAHDFAILRGKKKVKESFSVRLAEKYKEMKEKKDVVMPEALEKSPAKNTDVADKSYLKDKPGSVKSDLKNLGRFLTGKKETNEEVESLDEKNVPTSPEKWAKAKAAAKSKFDVYPSAYANGWASKKYKAMGGGWKSVSEESEEQLDEMINEVLSKDASAGDWIKDFVHSDNPKFAGKSKAERKKMALGAYYGKQRNEGVDSVPFEGPYTKTPSNVKDKSGAVHTPMSRAKDLARLAFKKVQDKTKIDK